MKCSSQLRNSRSFARKRAKNLSYQNANLLDWLQSQNLDVEAPLGGYLLWGVYRADRLLVAEGATLKEAIKRAIKVNTLCTPKERLAPPAKTAQATPAEKSRALAPVSSRKKRKFKPQRG